MGVAFNPFTGNFDFVEKTTIGNPVISGIANSLLYIDSSGLLAQNNPGLTYDGKTLTIDIADATDNTGLDCIKPTINLSGDVTTDLTTVNHSQIYTISNVSGDVSGTSSIIGLTGYRAYNTLTGTYSGNGSACNTWGHHVTNRIDIDLTGTSATSETYGSYLFNWWTGSISDASQSVSMTGLKVWNFGSIGTTGTTSSTGADIVVSQTCDEAIGLKVSASGGAAINLAIQATGDVSVDGNVTTTNRVYSNYIYPYDASFIGCVGDFSGGAAYDLTGWVYLKDYYGTNFIETEYRKFFSADGTTEIFNIYGSTLDMSADIDLNGNDIVAGGNIAASSISKGISIKHKNGTETFYMPASDTDAARGTALLTAISALAEYDVMHVAPGTYDIGANDFTDNEPLPDYVSIIGSGIDVTILETSLGSISTVLMQPGNYNFFADFTLYGSLTDGSYQLLFGNKYSGGSAFTGVVLRNVKMKCDSDGVYLASSNAGSLKMFNCITDTKYDAVRAMYGDDHQIDIYNCHFKVSGPSNTGSNKSRGVAVRNGTVRIFGSLIEVYDGGTTTTAALYTDGGTIEAYDVKTIVSSAGGTVADLYNSSGTIKVSGGYGSGADGAYTEEGTITYAQSKVATLTSVGTASGADPTGDTDFVTKQYFEANDCPKYIYIASTGNSEGDIHLSDGTNWNTSKAQIKYIRIKTSATDWDGYLMFNDNGYATDDGTMKKLQIMNQGNGDKEIYLDLPYVDEDTSGEVHLYLIDNSGSNTFDIYITGIEMR